jgi:hypothetical protein
VQVGLKPTLAAAHSRSSSAVAAGYQYDISSAVKGAAVGEPVGAAVGGIQRCHIGRYYVNSTIRIR